MKSFFDHVAKYRYVYIWPALAVLWLYGSGLVAQWLNHGMPLRDDPSAIYGYALQVVPIINAMFCTALYSAFLNNSMTRDEYATSDWKGKAVDNAPELIVLTLFLWVQHA